MLFTGTIPEQVEYFDPKDKELWSQRKAPWLVCDPAYRFKYCRVDKDMRPMHGDPYDFGRPHYFTSAWFISRRKNTFDMFWHERYKLALSRTDGKHSPGNEIKDLLGHSIVEKLHSVNYYFPKAFNHLRPKPNSLVEFKDPDVVAFREPRSFGFYEIKGEREGFQFLQLESLAILKTLIPDVDVAVVRMIEKGRSYSPADHPYSFSLDLDV